MKKRIIMKMPECQAGILTQRTRRTQSFAEEVRKPGQKEENKTGLTGFPGY
jgi:hypothetical protein